MIDTTHANRLAGRRINDRERSPRQLTLGVEPCPALLNALNDRDGISLDAGAGPLKRSIAGSLDASARKLPSAEPQGLSTTTSSDNVTGDLNCLAPSRRME